MNRLLFVLGIAVLGLVLLAACSDDTEPTSTPVNTAVPATGTVDPEPTESVATAVPAREEPTATAEPAAEEPTATAEPATEEPTATAEPVNEEPMATAEPAAKEPTATAEPAMAEPVMTADVSVSFALGELNSSGQSGAATLTANGDSTVVTLQLSGGDLEMELVHIHNGQCGDSLAGVAHALTNFADGAGTSVTTIDASLDSLLAGTFAINAHQSGNPETYTACGNVLVGGGETSAQASLEADIRRFTLPALTIAVGTTVQWTNQDRTTHTVTLGSNGVGDEGGFESGNLGGGGTFEFTFDTTGSFAYTCRIHPSMNAIIEVTDGSSSPGVPSIGVVHPRP